MGLIFRISRVASGGPFFSALPEKKGGGEKGGLGYVNRSNSRGLGQGGNELFRFCVGEAVAHIGEVLAQAGSFFPDVRIAHDAVGDQVRKRVISFTPMRSAPEAVKPSSSGVA